MTEIPSLKDEELDVIGELISNMYGALSSQTSKMVPIKGLPTGFKAERPAILYKSSGCFMYWWIACYVTIICNNRSLINNFHTFEA
jgi:hypothetical protein